MNPEQPKQYTPEEIAELEKSRTIFLTLGLCRE